MSFIQSQTFPAGDHDKHCVLFSENADSIKKCADVRTREEKSSRYFADDDGDAGGGDPFESIELSNSNNGRINTQELLLLEDNSKFVRQREKEINVIVKSIVELNTVFKDLAHMVTEQVRSTLMLQ